MAWDDVKFYAFSNQAYFEEIDPLVQKLLTIAASVSNGNTVRWCDEGRHCASVASGSLGGGGGARFACRFSRRKNFSQTERQEKPNILYRGRHPSFLLFFFADVDFLKQNDFVPPNNNAQIICQSSWRSQRGWNFTPLRSGGGRIFSPTMKF